MQDYPSCIYHNIIKTKAHMLIQSRLVSSLHIESQSQLHLPESPAVVSPADDVIAVACKEQAWLLRKLLGCCHWTVCSRCTSPQESHQPRPSTTWRAACWKVRAGADRTVVSDVRRCIHTGRHDGMFGRVTLSSQSTHCIHILTCAGNLKLKSDWLPIATLTLHVCTEFDIGRWSPEYVM